MHHSVKDLTYPTHEKPSCKQLASQLHFHILAKALPVSLRHWKVLQYLLMPMSMRTTGAYGRVHVRLCSRSIVFLQLTWLHGRCASSGATLVVAVVSA